MKIHIFTFNLFREHTMVAYRDGMKSKSASDDAELKECVVVDPGFFNDQEKQEFFKWMDDNEKKPVAVLLTHGHVDHVSGVRDVLDRYGDIPVRMGEADTVEIENNIRICTKLGIRAPGLFGFSAVCDGEILEYAGLRFKVITTPGHSPGGVCYLEEEEKVMFTGDTLFAGTIGRTDFTTSDYDEEIRSIMEKLIFLDGDIEIYPGHGDSSTIARERCTNPFLEPFNEKEELEGALSEDR